MWLAGYLEVGSALAAKHFGAYTPSVVEAYKTETHKVLERFLHHSFTFPECISALDSALAAVIPKLKPSQLPELRAVMLENNERVMKEMGKRERARKSHAKSAAKKQHASD